MRNEERIMENKEVERHYRQEDTTGEQSFDELAKGLADGTLSRGRLLEGVVGAIAGSTALFALPGKCMSSAIAILPARYRVFLKRRGKLASSGGVARATPCHFESNAIFDAKPAKPQDPLFARPVFAGVIFF
jgi:hypothetical protein